MNSITSSTHTPSGLVGNAKHKPMKSSMQQADVRQADVQQSGAASQSSKVTISGQAMLMSRLFDYDNTSILHKDEAAPTATRSSTSVYSFLTDEDKNVLSSLYEMAASEGTNLVEVDNIAFDLAHYRRAGPGGPIDTTGLLYDEKGQVIISKFNPDDEAIAQRVATSKAMGDTQFDKGFLISVFTPGRTPVHASDFSFLERAVYHLSAKGFDGATDPNAKPLVRPIEQDFEPLKLTHEDISAGNDTMISRLSSNEVIGVPKSSSLLVAEQLLNLLNQEDQLFLSKLYAGAHKRNEDLSRLDNIADTIAGYRLMGKTP